MKERGLDQYHQVHISEITSDIVCLDVTLTPTSMPSTLTSTVIQTSGKSLVMHQLHGNTTCTSMISMSSMTVIDLPTSDFMI